MAELRPKRIAEFVRRFRVEPGRKVRLPRDFETAGQRTQSNAEAKAILAGVELLAEYQTRLAAQDTYGVVMVLQAMDAAGKDGTIRHVMSGVNPQGVQVSGFKVPSAEDLDHDYLWRYAKKLPARGDIGIFNRSYYEEVLVVRVHPPDPGRPEDPAQPPRRATSGTAASARSTTGSTTSPTRDSGSSSCSSTSARRSSARASCRASTSPRRTGSSAPTTPRSGPSGTTIRRPFPRCSPTPAPSGRRGTSSPRTTSRSRASRPPPSSPTP